MIQEKNIHLIRYTLQKKQKYVMQYCPKLHAFIYSYINNSNNL